jgi:hypothetical protein
MHNEREENSVTRPRETERLNGELEIDYQRNRVMFHPNALREFTFSFTAHAVGRRCRPESSADYSKTGHAQFPQLQRQKSSCRL